MGDGGESAENYEGVESKMTIDDRLLNIITCRRSVVTFTSSADETVT